MKKLILILTVVSFVLSSCASVKNLNDYDSETFAKKTYSDRKVLGSVTVSKLDWVWSKY